MLDAFDFFPMACVLKNTAAACGTTRQTLALAANTCLVQTLVPSAQDAIPVYLNAISPDAIRATSRVLVPPLTSNNATMQTQLTVDHDHARTLIASGGAAMIVSPIPFSRGRRGIDTTQSAMQVATTH